MMSVILYLIILEFVFGNRLTVDFLYVVLCAVCIVRVNVVLTVRLSFEF